MPEVRGTQGAPLERETELSRIRAQVASAPDGHGSTLGIVGPAGIGKTRLLACLRAEAAGAGIRVLTARGVELEHGFPFGVARQLFEPVLAPAPDEVRERLLDGAAHLAAGLVAEPPSSSPTSPDESSFGAMHGLYWLTANLAETSPVLLAVDDAHWSDPSTLRFLAYLAARLDDLPVLLGFTMRSDEPGAPADLLEAIAGTPRATILRPAPLSEHAVGQLVADRFEQRPEAGFVMASSAATGGNPFLLHELITSLMAEGIQPTAASARMVSNIGPETISRAILVRLGRTAPGAHALARAVAICGADVDLRDAAVLAGLDEDEAARLADELARIEILRPGHPLTFVHPIVAHVVYEEIPSGTRSNGHRQAARLLADRGADPEAVAAHLLSTRPSSDRWVVEHLLQAAELATARGAPEEAATVLERARSEPPPDTELHRVLLELGTCLAILHRHDEATSCLRRALDLVGDPRERAEITRRLAAILMLEPDTVPEAVELLDAAASALPGDAEHLGAQIEGDIATASFLTLDGRRAALARRPRFADSLRPQVLAGQAMTKVMFDGPAGESAALARQALADGRLLAEETADSTTFWLAATALLYAMQLEEAEAVMSAAIEEATTRGSLRGVTLGSSLRARTRLLLGRILEAEEDARRSLDLVPDVLGLGPAFLVDALLEQGRYEEAARAIETARPVGINSSMYHFQIVSRGTLKIRRGEIREGLDELFELARGFEGWGTATPGPLQWRPMVAEALASLGETRKAKRLLEPELESCRAFGAPICLGIALRSAGVVEDGDEGIGLLEQAAATLAPTPARLEHAKTLVEMGAALRRARRPTDARGWLSEGMTIARRCGAIAVAERAYEELRSTGARPRKIVRTGIESLTPSERRACQMAAKGMSNRDIAQSLFVTVRTVETHLASSYRKLDIASRAQLAERLEPEAHA